MPARARPTSLALSVRPLTAERWPDLLRLFGPRGACAGCWCMWWRLGRKEWEAGKAGRNRRRLEEYVREGHVPGLLAYEGDQPVGWVAIEPREAYPRLARARTLAPVDDLQVWSVTCFFVARPQRGKGVTRALIDAAVLHARERGAVAVEAYPVAYAGEVGDTFVYTGAASTFLDLGFREVARRSPTRPIVRKVLRRRAAGAGRGAGSAAARRAAPPGVLGGRRPRFRR